MPISLEERYGLNRVVGEPGVFPQRAQKLDPAPTVGPGEILVEVERLHLDAASFFQLSEVNEGDPDRIAAEIRIIVEERGKMQNPVTGSGGMLVGTVRRVGDAAAAERDVAPGQRIASLVSLTLTPLRLDEIVSVDPGLGLVEVRGTAILFISSPFAVLPGDIDERIAIAAFDVAGAPARTATLVKAGQTIALIGAGTAGLLTLAAARTVGGPRATIIVTDRSEERLDDVRETGLADHVIFADAARALELYRTVTFAIEGEADLTVNMVNTPNTELGSILITKQSGTVLFFSLATSFSAAALGAEGLGRATTMQIGNGHMPDMGATAMAMLREHPRVRAVFERRYGAGS